MSVRLRFKVPSVEDKSQDNFIGLLNYEIQKVKAELTNKIDNTKSDMKVEIENDLKTDVSNLVTNLKGFINTSSSTSENTIKTDVNSKLTEYNNHAVTMLAEKANQQTVDALDQFARVVNSAIEIGTYKYSGVKTGIMDPITVSVSGFGLQTRSTTSITLQWNALNVAGVLGYKIYNTSDVTTPIAILDSALETSYTVSGLTEYTSYSFLISAFNNAGNGPTANSGAIYTLTSLAPMEFGFVDEDVTYNSITLKMKRAESPFTQLDMLFIPPSEVSPPYSIIINNSELTELVSGTTDVYKYVVSNLSSQTQYGFRIAHVTAYGTSANTNTITKTTLAALPPGPIPSMPTRGTIAALNSTTNFNNDVNLIDSSVPVDAVTNTKIYDITSVTAASNNITGFKFSDSAFIINGTRVTIFNNSNVPINIFKNDISARSTAGYLHNPADFSGSGAIPWSSQGYQIATTNFGANVSIEIGVGNSRVFEYSSNDTWVLQV